MGVYERRCEEAGRGGAFAVNGNGTDVASAPGVNDVSIFDQLRGMNG
jgi:hypothetical protein